jgi:hypothetical protein
VKGDGIENTAETGVLTGKGLDKLGQVRHEERIE